MHIMSTSISSGVAGGSRDCGSRSFSRSRKAGELPERLAEYVPGVERREEDLTTASYEATSHPRWKARREAVPTMPFSPQRVKWWRRKRAESGKMNHSDGYLFGEWGPKRSSGAGGKTAERATRKRRHPPPAAQSRERWRAWLDLSGVAEL